MCELYCSHLSSLKMWKQQSTQTLREGLQGSILGCTGREWLENCWAGLPWSHVEDKRERRRWYFSWPMSSTSFACMRAQSLQLCTALWGPVDCSLPGSSCPWHSLDKNTGEGCHFLLQGILPSQHQTLVSYVSCVTGVLYRVTFEILQAALTSRPNLHVSISKSTSIKSERNLQRLKKKKKRMDFNDIM